MGSDLPTVAAPWATPPSRDAHDGATDGTAVPRRPRRVPSRCRPTTPTAGRRPGAVPVPRHHPTAGRRPWCRAGCRATTPTAGAVPGAVPGCRATTPPPGAVPGAVPGCRATTPTAGRRPRCRAGCRATTPTAGLVAPAVGAGVAPPPPPPPMYAPMYAPMPPPPPPATYPVTGYAPQSRGLWRWPRAPGCWPSCSSCSAPWSVSGSTRSTGTEPFGPLKGLDQAIARLEVGVAPRQSDTPPTR